MTSPCFTTTNSCCSSTIRKGDVTKKPDVPNINDCDWDVWRGKGKRYVKQRRTIASIDDRTDVNNRPNKRNRIINSSDDDDDEMKRGKMMRIRIMMVIMH